MCVSVCQSASCIGAKKPLVFNNQEMFMHDFSACKTKTSWRKIKIKKVNLTEVNFLLALWALWHFVAAVLIYRRENTVGILWMKCDCSCTDWPTC